MDPLALFQAKRSLVASNAVPEKDREQTRRQTLPSQLRILRAYGSRKFTQDPNEGQLPIAFLTAEPP